MQRRSLVAGVVLALGAVLAPADPGHASDDAAAWRRSAADVLRRGSDEQRAALLTEVVAQPDKLAAIEVGIDAVGVLSARVAAASKERDEQGKKLFQFYTRYVLKAELPRERYTEYRVLEIQNHKLCLELKARLAELTSFSAATADAGAQLRDDPARVSGAADVARRRVAAPGGSDVKAAVVRSLRGPLLGHLVEDLHGWARPSSDRALATAALSTLLTRPELADPARLAPLASSQDPVVRRHLYRVLAARGDAASLDILVEAVAREVGVPSLEVVQLLRRVTGRTLGQDPRAWAGWWEGQRATWSAPVAAHDVSGDLVAREYSRYFGLPLYSARVLFVIDRSLSMDWPITHGGGDSLTQEDLRAESKIAVAKRELLTALDALDETASFNILAYGTSLESFRPRLVTADARNLASARRYVEKLELEGSTNLAGALLAAMEVARPGRPERDDDVADTLVVLSDGEPNCGPIADRDDLLDELRRQDPDGMVTVHAVFLGVAGDAEFTRKLAEQAGGRFVHHKR